MRFARIGAGALVLATIAGFGWWLRPASPSPEPLVLAVTQTTFGAPLWVAQQGGVFAAGGLAVTLRPYATGKLAFEAMLRGEAQVATVTETPLVFASLAGTPFTVIASYAASTEHSLVASFAPYSAQCRLALGPVARSFGTGIRYTGYGNLVAPRDLPGARPEAMLRLLRALDRTIAWMRRNPDESLALAAAGSGTETALLKDGWDTLRPRLGLDQGLVVLLQAEARWAIGAGLVPGLAPGAAVPEYRDFIDATALARLSPEAVTMVGKL